MSIVILPCAGRRFIYGTPQYLLRHPNGKLLIERSIEGIFMAGHDKIYIAVLKDDVERFDAKERIISGFSEKYPIEVLTLPDMTSGPAETVYQALKMLDISGEIVIKDSDNYIKISDQITGNFVAGLDLNRWERDIDNLRSKSFLILNEQNNILDIIEKKIRSDVICMGLYGFKNAGDFVEAYEKLNDTSYPIHSLYVSHIISYLIGCYNKVFRYIHATEYEGWGDEKLWTDLQRDYTLYFIDLDNILGISGILTQENKKKLRILQSRGASFIGYTTNDEKYKTAALHILEDAGLKFIKVIYGCPHSVKKEIIDSDEVLGRKIIEL